MQGNRQVCQTATAFFTSGHPGGNSRGDDIKAMLLLYSSSIASPYSTSFSPLVMSGLVDSEPSGLSTRISSYPEQNAYVGSLEEVANVIFLTFLQLNEPRNDRYRKIVQSYRVSADDDFVQLLVQRSAQRGSNNEVALDDRTSSTVEDSAARMMGFYWQGDPIGQPESTSYTDILMFLYSCCSCYSDVEYVVIRYPS